MRITRRSGLSDVEVQSIIDAGEQSGLVVRGDDVRDVAPTAAEYEATPNDIVQVKLSDGTCEYWQADENGEFGSTPALTLERSAAFNKRVVSENDTIKDLGFIVANNTTPITLTVGADVKHFRVGRSTDSTAVVTVVPPTGFTISDDPTGVVLNEAYGPVEFTLDGSNYVVEVPGATPNAAGAITATELAVAILNSSAVIDATDEAARLASGAIVGTLVKQGDNDSIYKLTKLPATTVDNWEFVGFHKTQNWDKVLAEGGTLTADRNIFAGGNRLGFLGASSFFVTATGAVSLTGATDVSYLISATGHGWNAVGDDRYTMAIDNMFYLTIREGDGIRLNAAGSSDDYILGDGAGGNLPPVKTTETTIPLVIDVATGKILRET